MMRPGSVMYSRAAEGIAKRNCEFCGRQLTGHQAVNGGLCGSAECHDRMIEKVGTELLARKRRENAAFRDAMFAAAEAPVAAAEAALPGAGDVVRATVPYQDRPVLPLPAERRAAFEAHLDAVIATAWDEGAPALDLTRRAVTEAPETALMDAACATCQGSCCHLGGNTGMLVWTDVQRYRQRASDATPESVRAVYLGYLPEASVSGACVYQSATGCTLPRTLRNDQCNTFHCKSQKLLAEAWAEAGTPRGAVLVAAQDRMVRKVARFDPAGGVVAVSLAAPEA